MKNLWIIISFLLLFSACADDAYQEGSTGRDSEMLVTLDLKVPGIQTTRLTGEEEEAITEVDLLAFDASGNYLYYKQGAKKGNYYEVTLKKTTEQQTFVVLANLRSQLGTEPTVGTAKADILKTIVFASTKTYTTLPMWGETKATISGAGTLSVKMLRAVARVDVKTNEVPTTDFELTEVVVYNSFSQGRAVPEAGNMKTNSAGNPVATAPTLITPLASKNDKLTYTTDANLFEREIYLSEYINKGVTDNSKRLCLVVGGKYKESDEVTYYRIDFFGKETDKDTGKETQVLKDILRNYRYNVVITSVSGPGYEKPDDAFDSTPINLEAEVVDWEESELPVVGNDGTCILAVNQMDFEFTKEQVEDPDDLASLLKVYTNNASGWKIEDVVYKDDEDNVVEDAEEWFAPSVTSTNSPNNEGEYTEVFLKRLLENTTEKSRKATFKVVAGNIKINIIVKQTASAGEGGKEYTLTATNSSNYMKGRTHSFTLTTMGNWEITEFSNLASGTTIEINDKEVTTGLTGTGSATPATVAVAAGSTAGKVSITFACTNGYFTNGNKDNEYKVTITFDIVSEIYYDTHNGWAGSNVYWDEENQRPTFDVDPGENNVNSFKQGIFFKWGSLVGLAPCGRTTVTNENWNANQYTVYYNTTATDYTVFNTNGDFTNFGTWKNIPYVSTGETSTKNRHQLLEVHNPANHIGDICKLISDNGWVEGQWRMPTAVEFGKVYEDVSGGGFNFDNNDYINIVSGTNGMLNVNGTGMIGAYQSKKASTNPENKNVVFPAAGGRHYSEGSLYLIADNKSVCGHYWSASPINSLFATTLWFYGEWNYGGVYANHQYSTHGYPVRCVRE